jgi:hypothetical protein
MTALHTSNGGFGSGQFRNADELFGDLDMDMDIDADG